MLVSCNVDNISFSQKPTQKEAGQISVRIGNEGQKKDMEFQDVVKAMLNGQTICPAYINGTPNIKNESDEEFLRRCDANFSHQQIFVIDADGMLSYKDFKTNADAWKLSPTAVLPSFSNGKNGMEKFHAFFVLPYPVYDRTIRAAIYRAIFDVFTKDLDSNKIDECVKDTPRLIFGTCHGIWHEDYNYYLDIKHLFEVALIMQQKQLASEEVVPYFASKYHIDIENIVEVNKIDEISDTIKYLQIDTNSYLKFTIIKEEIKEVKDSEVSYRALNVDFNKLETICDAFSDFKNEYYISGHQTNPKYLMVASNICKMADGDTYVKNILNKNGYGGKNSNIWKYCFNQYNNGGGPQRCDACPYNSSCDTLAAFKQNSKAIPNIINIARFHLGGNFIPTKLSNTLITLQQAEIQLNNYMNTALNMQTNHITVVKAPTGIGKTEIIFNNLGPNDLLAVPDHTLLSEVVQRFIQSGNPTPFIHAVDVPELTNKAVYNKILQYFTLGETYSARNLLDKYYRDSIRSILTKIADDKMSVYHKQLENRLRQPMKLNQHHWTYKQRKHKFDYFKDQIVANDYVHLLNTEQLSIKKYKDAIFEIEHNTNKIIFCTHAKVMGLQNTNINRYIIDEDPMDTALIGVEKTSYKELELVIKYLNENLVKFNNFYNTNPTNEIAQRILNIQNTVKKITKILNHLDNKHKLFLDAKVKLGEKDIVYFPITLNFSKSEMFEIKTIVKQKFNDFKTGLIKFLHVKNIENSETKDIFDNRIEDLKPIVVGMNINKEIQYTANNFNKLKNKKVIILSATAEEDMYRKVYPEVNFLKIDETEISGEIEQYYISAGRTALRDILSNPDKLKKLKDIVLDDTIITFKGLKQEFDKANQGFKVWEYGHYGKSTGQDNLKGENVSVVGTPYDHPIKYVLTAMTLGYSTKELNLEFIKNKGVIRQPNWCNLPIKKYIVDEFNVQTFRNKYLRMIQFHFISSELTQAVGRARALREKDAHVVVISNFPVLGAMPRKFD